MVRLSEARDGWGRRLLSRRSALVGAAGLLAAGCGSAAKRAVGPLGTAPPPAPAGAAGRALATPPQGVPLTPPTTTAEAGAALTRVPTLAVPPRTRPAYYVDQILAAPPPNAVALTIDDGPDPRYTPAVLGLLAQYGVTASFSVIGRSARRYPGLLKTIVAEGHALTNHSMTHPQPFATVPPARMQAEVVGCLEAIYDATGRPPTSFRSPGGDWSPAMFGLIAELGMVPIDWDVDPRDWARPGTSAIVSRLLAAKPHDILLCHDGGGDRSETVAALRTVLPVLKARDLTFVTL